MIRRTKYAIVRNIFVAYGSGASVDIGSYDGHGVDVYK